MSFDKHMGKDWREQYSGATAIDHTCRNHGSCSYCMSTRTWFDTKRRQAANQDMNDYYDHDYYNECNDDYYENYD